MTNVKIAVFAPIPSASDSTATVVRVHSATSPGAGFELVEPNLEDVYFSTMAGHYTMLGEVPGEGPGEGPVLEMAR